MTFQTTRNFELRPLRRRVNDVEHAMALLPKEADVDESVLGTAFLVSPYASFVLDWSGRILVCNRRAERLYCPPKIADPEGMRGVQISDLTSLSQEDMAGTLRMGAARGVVELPIHSGAQIGNPSTTVFRVSLLRSAVRGERLILLTQDQLKTTAEALTNMNTKRLQLREKLDRLEAAHVELHQTLFSMEAFAQAAAHDLRTPINTLSGLIEMFQTNFENETSPKGKEFLQYMARATAQMNDYTSELLKHARSSSAQIIAEPLDVSDVISDVCANLKTQITDSRTKIDVIGTSFKVMAEPTMIQILVTNLITNAIKYKSPHRPSEIEIRLSSRGAGKVSFKDNGVGFDQSQADAVFQPFRRLSMHTEGHGIGLATCAEVCRRHNWKIETTAAIDQGVTFTIAFG